MSEISEKFAKLKSSTSRLRNTTAAERTARIQALWEATVDRKDDLIKAAHHERGTHDLDMAAELVMLKSEVDFFKKNLAKWMKPEKIKNSLATMGKKCEIRRQSKGVVLNMAAYNAPTAESFVPMLAAVAAGNAVAIKPSELAPESAQIIQEIVNKAFPTDEAEVFQGGVDVAKELLKQPFDHIYYTGGTAVGKIVMKAAADNLTSITLEMGGKNPVIIDETAKLENAATKLAWGRVMNAGQVCIAPDYAIVHESVKDEFQNLISEKIQEQYNSEQTGLDKSNYVPRIINERHTKRIKALLDDAVKKGATIVSGGTVNLKDCYVEPTILTDVTEDMNIMQEEVFGPILCVVGYQNREDVLKHIAPRTNSLALYIYSTNDSNIEYFLNNTSSGSAVVNNNCIQSGTNPRLPFGGIGASGMGRIGGYEGFRSMSNERSVVHQPLDKFRDFLIQLPPYSDRYAGLIMKGVKK
ncbi:MAG: aldehyde dehydrogenase family protein [Hyphomonadaceae bacterium]|nr:aldehyde dehydrogenase family protein [Hyphomonadaceae bacterium]